MNAIKVTLTMLTAATSLAESSPDGFAMTDVIGPQMCAGIGVGMDEDYQLKNVMITI